MATGSSVSATTLDGKEILMEGWLTVHKSRNPTFLTKQKSDKVLERAWSVVHAYSSKGPLLSFFQDSKKTNKVLKREKLELMSVKLVTKVLDHPRHNNCFTLKVKSKRNRLLFDCDSSAEVHSWLSCICEILSVDYKMERVIWEYLGDDNVWQSLPSEVSYTIEENYFLQKNNFGLGKNDDSFSYNLSSMNRAQALAKQTQRIKRTPFIWDKPETLHQKMKDLPAIWEWGDPSKDEWHPFERDTNIQIEEMYDSGSQWAELTLCIPSPILLLLNLQDMKLVNSRTSTRYCLRRIDNSSNMAQDNLFPNAQTPSDDESDGGQDDTHNGISPVSPLFQPLQSHLQHLQIPRGNVKLRSLLGEGAFGEVFLSDVRGLNGEDKVVEMAVKQLRLSDFIARHGQHSQQMEDFLREAKEMAKVNHHRVVKLLAVCTLDFPLLLIEEYMNQGDLLGVLKDYRPSMPLDLQLSLAWQVSDGMDYLASELQCVHRDLAARNVMVNKDEKGEISAKIADFGLSRHLYSEMYKHQGSKPRPLPAKWMALESLMYFVFSTRSDVWSFGVLLWEIMTLGRTPYPGVENRELLEQIEEHGLKLSRPKACPLVLYELILDCTQHSPDDRPTFLSLQEQLFDLHEQAVKGTLVSDLDTSSSMPNGAGSTPESNKSTDQNFTSGTIANTKGTSTSSDDDKHDTQTTAAGSSVSDTTEDTGNNTSDDQHHGGTVIIRGGGGSVKVKKTDDDNVSDFVVVEGADSMQPTNSQVPLTQDTPSCSTSVSETINLSVSQSTTTPLRSPQHTSEINLDEINIIDSRADENTESAEHFYYVIDDDSLMKPTSDSDPSSNSVNVNPSSLPSSPQNNLSANNVIVVSDKKDGHP